MRRACRKDANQAEIFKALREAGASVLDMSDLGDDRPDGAIGFNGKTVLIEVKNPKTGYGKKGLTKGQATWREGWKGGPYVVVTDVEGALRVLGVMEA